MASDRLYGWLEIAKYLGNINVTTAQRYEKNRGLPIHRLPGGTKPPVFAIRAELDAWTETNVPPARRAVLRARSPALIRDQGLTGPVFDRIRKLSNLTLYRRNYSLHFMLRRSAQGVRANLECRYKVCNATEERQRFVQEVTVDEPDHGYVEEMVYLVDGKPVYVLRRPVVSEKPLGYSIFRGMEIEIEPDSRGVHHECRASWVINRSRNDFWGTHMALPTIGVAVKTHAPADFNITPPFSTPELVMTGEHVDVAWNYRPRSRANRP
ncbi:MAG TPA: hypothetical protein VI386_00500 [Candidatus Sulfotelmatobacter sp.]